MIPRKFLQEWAEEQKRAFLAAVGLSETPAAAQTVSTENQEPTLEEPAPPHQSAIQGFGAEGSGRKDRRTRPGGTLASETAGIIDVAA